MNPEGFECTYLRSPLCTIKGPYPLTYESFDANVDPVDHRRIRRKV